MVIIMGASIDDSVIERKRPKKGMRFLKTMVLGTALLGSAYLGDSYNVADRFVNPIVYHSADSERGFTDSPFSLEKRVIKNDDGNLETYFGNRNTGEYMRVRENDHTANMLDDVFDATRMRYEDAVDYVRDNFFGSEE